MFQSYGNSALAQQVDVPSQYFLSILVIGVFDFPGIGAVLTRTEVVGAVPVVFEVCEFVNELTPTVVNTDFYFEVIAPDYAEILVKHIAVGCKCIRYVKERIKKDMDLTLSGTAILIRKKYGIDRVLVRVYGSRLAAWARNFVRR
jgi:hypothetical protein